MIVTKVLAVVGAFCVCCFIMAVLWVFAETNMSEDEVLGFMFLSTTIAGGVYAILLHYVYKGE